MKKNMFFIVSLILMVSGCSSSRVKKDFGTEYGWMCPGKENSKSFVKYKVPNEEKDSCIKLRNYKDPTADFYVRSYEKDTLPPMPDLP